MKKASSGNERGAEAQGFFGYFAAKKSTRLKPIGKWN